MKEDEIYWIFTVGAVIKIIHYAESCERFKIKILRPDYKKIIFPYFAPQHADFATKFPKNAHRTPKKCFIKTEMGIQKAESYADFRSAGRISKQCIGEKF